MAYRAHLDLRVTTVLLLENTSLCRLLFATLESLLQFLDNLDSQQGHQKSDRSRSRRTK
jgi:hypothetical protein